MDVVVPDEFKYLYVQNKEKPVVKIPAEVLRQKAAEVVKVARKHSLLIDDMIRIMKQANGIGLAAPQIGIGQRILVMAPQGMRATGFINPVIVKAEGEQVGQEGCLSIPGLYGDVKRADFVVVEALDRKGRPVTYEFEGLAARVAQHEIDHLDGVLFIDKVDPATLYWSHPDADDEVE
ncbi:MAG: peptide deformylase [Armatimonadetes bacterium 55-13]|mgnify:CR=1 FL=1|nr:peptide deformylase [Armatimonadota bacterium]OJU63983.1 MAG: peptide deformylase [Armatimonadetes bacterium 55-13]